MSFKRRIRKRSILIAAIPLILSWAFFLKIRVDDINDRIKQDLKQTSFVVSSTPTVQEKLKERKNDFTIQNYVKKYMETFENVDIIVVGDMTEEKYSHLDESQIGKKYVNSDAKRVVETGESYYSTMKGSMGVTLRYFEPVYYKGKQVGFVMVGKYLKDVEAVTNRIIYIGLFSLVVVMIITIFLSESFARKIKKEMLGMEPDEIARLYNEKKVILNTISEGIIAIDKNKKILEINDNCLKIFENLNIDELIEKLSDYIDKKEPIDMKEFNISGEKTFITLDFIKDEDRELGALITLVKSEDINRVAREITGIDELLKNIRANVHEFKNKLHVILGLINIEEYEEAKKYIAECQEEVLKSSTRVANINDNFISAMLISKRLIANENNISFKINEKSYMKETHGNISSVDLITILGNLIENAFDACLEKEGQGQVDVFIDEDEENVIIEVSDNGKKIDEEIKDDIFKNGVSSKGKGRGIGLSTIKGRVDLYGGNIEIKEFRKQKKFRITIKRRE
ncbi:sensor histidine kinase [Clostridium baratii]|uniref:sensor histidine kinase n=1 Tax=Clostridium baratii TaxID=1561 RepID=UPI002A75B18B|nr:sensor histidine kinase [Clostridium baratii]MDY3207231.1 sensor histidine kinase [Clostridium baratii]